MVSTELLRRYPLFAGQSHYMLEEIAILSQEAEYEKDDWLFNENEDASKLYLVLTGSVSLCTLLFLNGSGVHVETSSPLRQGEIVGWSAIVKPHIYTLGAQVNESSSLLIIDAEPLRELLDDNPQFGYYFLKNLSEVIGDRLVNKCIQLLSMVTDKQGKPI